MSPATPTDSALIEEILDGGLHAYEELMRRYERLVYSVAIGFGRSREDALDITQNTFLKAYRALASFRRDANFKTWLMRIAYNESVTWLRRHSRHLDKHDAIETSEQLTQNAPSQEQALLSQEETQFLFQGLGKINKRYRLALTLRYFHDLSLREIAEVLECSEGVVKNSLFRGVRSLKKQIAEAVPS